MLVLLLIQVETVKKQTLRVLKTQNFHFYRDGFRCENCLNARLNG